MRPIGRQWAAAAVLFATPVGSGCGDGEVTDGPLASASEELDTRLGPLFLEGLWDGLPLDNQRYLCAEYSSGGSQFVGELMESFAADGVATPYTSRQFEDVLDTNCTSKSEVSDKQSDSGRSDFDVPPSLMNLNIESCTRPGRTAAGSITGTVMNGSSTTVDVQIRGTVNDEDDVQVDDGLDDVRSLRPGKAARWEVIILEEFESCHAQIDSTRER